MGYICCVEYVLQIPYDVLWCSGEFVYENKKLIIIHKLVIYFYVLYVYVSYEFLCCRCFVHVNESYGNISYDFLFCRSFVCGLQVRVRILFT